MPVTRIRIVLKPTTMRGNIAERAVDCNGVQFTVLLRPLDPVVQVAGVELRWEMRIRMPDERTFDGYGPDQETAFARAGEAATKGGVLDARLWRAVAEAVARPADDARLAHHLKS